MNGSAFSTEVHRGTTMWVWSISKFSVIWIIQYFPKHFVAVPYNYTEQHHSWLQYNFAATYILFWCILFVLLCTMFTYIHYSVYNSTK